MTSHSSRGPRREQIDGGDPTFRIEIEDLNGRRRIMPEYELLTSDEAIAAIHRVWAVTRGHVRAVHVVNEWTGFTRDTIGRG